MKQKWYFNTLLFILAILGISLVDVATPNQEIVVHFSDTEITQEETQHVIADVKKQLQAIGVDEIQVQEFADGRLKITYYSTVDVVAIQKIFSTKKSELLAFTDGKPLHTDNSVPLKKDSDYYKLDVSEIQNSNNHETGFNGHALELDSKSDRFFIPDVYFLKPEMVISGKNRIEQVAFKVYFKNALAINNFSYKIPEIRAGPGSIG